MTKLVFLIVSASLAAMVAGHAVLTSPVPWNPEPRTASPCGGGAAQGTASLQITTGSTITIGWTVKAGDGNGPVTLKFAPQTAANPTVPANNAAFSNPVTLSPTPVAVTSYTLSGTLPNLTPGLYTMQAASSTGWYSCTTVQILAAGTTPGGGSGGQAGGGSATPAYTQQCVARAAQLFYCGAYRQQAAQIAPGTQIDVGGNAALAQSQLNAESFVSDAIQVNLNNTRVLGTGLSQACEFAYRRFLCAHAFPLCGNPHEMPACKSACYEFADVCGLTDSHKGLYDCAAMQVTGSDSMGTCAPCTGACALTLGAGSQVTYSLALLVWLFAALLAL